MSKSLGNFFTVRDLLDQGWPGEVIRFVMLSTHYRKPMDWTEEKAKAAERELWLWGLETADIEPAEQVPEPFIATLADDLNTHAAITVLRDLFKNEEYRSLKSALQFLGFDLKADQSSTAALKHMKSYYPYTQKIEDALKARLEAKRNREYKKADEIRAVLGAAGVSLKDEPDGSTTYKVDRNFDPIKLEALK